jgi:EF-P beta-lysylation protein EpmB
MITSGIRAAEGRPTAAAEPSWTTTLAEAIRDPAELCRLLDLPAALAEAAVAASQQFPLLVPRTYLARICPGEPRDPLLRQILPTGEELRAVPQFVADPLGEAALRDGPGLLAKYHGRILIVTTGACAVHCRFCFRRHLTTGPHWQSQYHTSRQSQRHTSEQSQRQAGTTALKESLDYVADQTSVEEVILSGGDPLTCSDRQLADFARQLARIPHVRRLRIHSRLPIMIPQRVTDELLTWLRETRLTTLLVLHVNHPAEIDQAVAEAIGRLADAGVPLLSQSVLLRGVNDEADLLAELFRRLIDLRVMPYYLHQLDRVAGTAHFEVDERRGSQLMAELRRRLPGYAVPRYVREVPGETGKRILGFVS